MPIIAKDVVGNATPAGAVAKALVKVDHTKPTLALSGSLTEQAKLGTTLPQYTLKYTASDGTEAAPQSGVASTEVKVDGNAVEAKYAPGCATKNCTISREWTLSAPQYAAGQHTVEVVATDGVGLSTTEKRTINIAKDTTAPALSVTGPFFAGPEGWLEQKSFTAVLSANDPGGYGLKSLALKFDGTTVKSVSISCPNGGCSSALTKSMNMALYGGGAHTAEVVATDGAGNVSAKSWTINVDPAGAITTTEATETLEAMEDTSPVNVVGKSEEEEELEGTATNLGFKESSGVIEAVGTLSPIAVGEGTSSCSSTIDALAPDILAEGPGTGESATEEEEVPLEEEPPNTEVPTLPLQSSVYIPEGDSAVLSPVSPPLGGCSQEVVGGVSAVDSNTSSEVDSAIRPLYDGLVDFQTIRGLDAPEAYSWTVNLHEGQQLRAIDEQHAAVYYEDGTAAMAIDATPAHDATGQAVATTLTVTAPNVVTLHVNFAGNGASGLVFPVVAGAGYQVGYSTVEVTIPVIAGPLAEQPEILELAEDNGYETRVANIGPPISIPNSEVPLAYRRAGHAKTRGYNFFQCTWRLADGEVPVTGLPANKRTNNGATRCHGVGENEYGQHVVVRWAVSMAGVYRYYRAQELWLEHEPGCTQWGEDAPKKIRCYATFDRSPNRTDILGEWRFPPAAYRGIGPQEYCYELDGGLNSNPPAREEDGSKFIHESYHEFAGARPWRSECEWGSLNKVR